MSNNKDFKVKNGLAVGGTIALGAIDTSISDTAVDVFVYDTSKDSDGGAWRKRCQHTSWYNETLNTSTRGATKEFPAVAVIVAEEQTITIYDGDDPSMPMWMVFNAGNYAYIAPTTRVTSSVAMLNGGLCICRKSSVGFMNYISFVDDTSRAYSSNVNEYRDWLKPIADRNTTDALVQQNAAYAIVNDQVNDVAMTVLSNAPIDSATNLPTPTIAVATNGGVSVIKDDGSVVDITWSNGSTSSVVSFLEDRLFVSHDFSAAVARHGHVFEIPTSDLAEGAYYSKGSAVEFYSPSGFKLAPSTESYVNIKHQAGDGFGFTGYSSKYDGLAVLQRNKSDYLKSSVANITSDYNTGWMHGDIKLAALSDTDDTDVTGSELVTNGTFDSDTSGWTDWSNITNPSAASQLGGKGILDASVSSPCDARQDITVVAGKTYVVSVTMVNASGAAGRLYISDGPNYSYAFGSIYATSTETTFTETITPTQNTVRLYAYVGSGTGSATFDNISVRLAEEDRSVNGNGLAVHGTITKDPVATGADLVGYSFGATGGTATVTNALIYPAFAAPTGDMSFMFWTTSRISDSELFTIGATNTSTPANGIHVWANADQLKCHWASTQMYSGTSDLNTASQFICVLRRGSALELYIDGTLRNSATNGTAITETDLTIGNGYYGGGGDDMALFRISATAPTAEQIKKIYNDEKPLFQENAKATLYGSSDAVTALAHDDSTNLLHVGTSAGRSVFRGLHRVDNTTDAVGTAISASNDLVVEE